MVTMSEKQDFYVVLGVDRTASAKEISDAYRKLAIQYHPDKNPDDDDAVRKFKEAAEAFEVLGDAEKRARYDRYGHAAFEGGGGGHQFRDVSDIFEAFGDIFGGTAFGDIFGGGRGRGRRVRQGADVRADVTLNLVEAARGVSKTVEFERHEKCDECSGTGAAPGSEPEVCGYCAGKGQILQSSGVFRLQTTCPSCRGEGSVINDPCRSCRGKRFVIQRVTRDVTIPAGVDDEMRLRLEGEGEPSPDGGPRGDCYCFIHVEEHELFEREGRHLICRIPITYPQAALGAEVEIPTLDGPETLTIPAGTQPGDVFRLRRKGMPDIQGRGVGDLHVYVQVEIPKRLSEREEELLRELAEEEHSNVSPHRSSFLEKVRDFFSASEDRAAAED